MPWTITNTMNLKVQLIADWQSRGLYNLWGSIGVVILRQIKQCGKNRKQDK